MSGTDNPRGQNFDVNRNLWSFRSVATSVKKSLWSLILYNFCHDFIHVYSQPRGRGRQPPGDKVLFQQKCLVTSFICAKFKNNVCEIWFYTKKFHLIHVYSPGAGTDSPKGTIFYVNRKALSLYLLVASFKEISLKSDYIHFFHDLIHVYDPG